MIIIKLKNIWHQKLFPERVWSCSGSQGFPFINNGQNYNLVCSVLVYLLRRREINFLAEWQNVFRRSVLLLIHWAAYCLLHYLCLTTLFQTHSFEWGGKEFKKIVWARILKETAVAYLKLLSGICMERLENATINLSRYPLESWSRYRATRVPCSRIQGTNSTRHTTKVNDTLKRNAEEAAKKDRMKISYKAN
jgi:hypothetical protein